MEFGVPRRREQGSNNEKYPNVAVLTASEFKGKGTGRTLTLNAKAIELLGVDFENPEVLISFSFNKIEETVSIANTTGLEGMSGVRLAKTSKSVSDKAYFEAIKENFSVDVKDAADFLLSDSGNEFNGHKVLSLSLMTATDALTETINEAVAETAPEEAPIEHVIEQAAQAEEAMAAIEVEEEQIAEDVTEKEFVPETIDVDAVSETVEAEKDFFAGFN